MQWRCICQYAHRGHTSRDISVEEDQTINTYDIAEKG